MDNATPNAGALAVTLPKATASTQPKGLDLAVIKRGAKDYLDFMDSTKEIFFAYVYHRTGSIELAKTLLGEIYLDTLNRAMSLWWFGKLHLGMLLDAADAALKSRDTVAADIDTVYIKNLTWLSADEKKAVSTLHDALWTLPREAQRVLILSLFLGLPAGRIGQVLGKQKEKVEAELKTAQDFLLTRWQPTSSVASKLTSLVFMPGLDIQSETKLRFNVVEKYNALRMRRYQWVIVGGLFAVLSNVIVASVLAFAVIVQPPTSLRGTQSQVASLDALLLERQLKLNSAKQSVATSFAEAQKLAAYDVSRDLTALGLAAALESLQAQQSQEKEVDRLIRLMERAQTAMAPVVAPVVKLAMHDLSSLVGWL